MIDKTTSQKYIWDDYSPVNIDKHKTNTKILIYQINSLILLTR